MPRHSTGNGTESHQPLPLFRWLRGRPAGGLRPGHHGQGHLRLSGGCIRAARSSRPGPQQGAGGGHSGSPAIAGTAPPLPRYLRCPRPLCRFWLRAAAQTGQPDGKIRSRDLSAILSPATQVARGTRRFMQHAPALCRRGVTVPDEGVRDLIALGAGH